LKAGQNLLGIAMRAAQAVHARRKRIDDGHETLHQIGLFILGAIDDLDVLIRER